MTAAETMVAARCTCGGAVFVDVDRERHILDGFLADHTPARRSRCTRVVTADDLDDVDRLLAGPAASVGQLALDFGGAS